MIRALFGLWLFIFAVSAQASGLFNPKSFVLANGMKVVVVEDSRAPIVHHMVWYRAGSADEPPRKSGIAHFFEHLMFKGTPAIPSGEFSKRVAALGGRDNAFTSYDYTAYFQTIARDRLGEMMRMEADRMANLRLNEADVRSELQVVLEERASRTDNSPAAILGERMMAALHPHHPYGTPIIGWEHEIKMLTRADALAWRRLHYAPNNAILIVAGDVKAEDVRRLAERHYGPLKARSVPPRLRPQNPPPVVAQRVILEHADVRQPSLRRLWPAPTRSAGDKRHAVPLMLLADILGGGSTSRLYRELVRDGKIAASAAAGYDETGLDPSNFTVALTPLPLADRTKATRDAAMAALENGLERTIERLLRDGVTEDELTRAKTILIAQTIYARDSLYIATRTLGAALTSGMTIEEVEALPDLIRAVTREQLQEAARAVLRPGASVTGLLLPEAQP